MLQNKQALTVSLIIPAYNEEDYLEACLQSIANQTSMPHEVIVVDNNSTDRTAEIARSFDFVRIVQESKQSIVDARNAGFNAASSDVIARIDADTILPKNWISRIQSFYANGKHHNSALTGGGYFYNVRFKRLNGWVQSQLAYRLNRVVVGHYILWGSNMALPTRLWKDVSADTCLRDDIHEDLDLAIHLHRKGYAIVYRPRLRVGVMLKRIYSDRSTLHAHMSRWPKTLHVHGYRLWWMGTLGNALLWFVLQPFAYIVEYFNRFILRKPPLQG